MARLPEPGKDQGTWGLILNDYLAQSHKNDGSLKDNSVTSSTIVSNAVSTAKLQDGSVTEAKLDSAVAIKLNAIAGQQGPEGPEGPQGPEGPEGPQGPAGAPGATTIAGITGLQTALDSKAASSHTHSISDVSNLQTSLNTLTTNLSTKANTADLTSGLSGKADTVHTHSAADITNLEGQVTEIIGNKLIPGTNVQINYDAGTGETTISSSAAGGGGGGSTTVDTVAGRVGDVVLVAGDITGGTFATARIPNLDATKITTGTLDVARIPTGTTGTTVAPGNHTHSGFATTSHTHSAAEITSGTLDTAQIPSLPASQIASGTLNIARIPTGTSGTTVALGDHTHTGYAASSHNHTVSDVTGLQTALDGKASTSHTHSIANVTGLQTALDAKQASGDFATNTALTSGLAGKANTSHNHSAANITSGLFTLATAAPGAVFRCPWNGSSWTYNGTVLSARPSSRTDIYFDYVGAPAATADPAWILPGDSRMDI